VGGSTKRLFSGTGATGELALRAELDDGAAPPPPADGDTVVIAPSDADAGPTELVPGRSLHLRRCPACDTGYSGAARFCSFDGTPLEAPSGWDPDADPLLGQTIAGRYFVEDVLAEGGMGTIYRVRHVKLESCFAMKVLRRDLAEDPEVALRLVEEARATAAIGHSNIVGATDFGEIDASVLEELGSVKLPYFVMEYVSGRSLADVVREEGPLEPDRIARIVLQVGSALAAAHKAGIVHRDLKPENIRLSRDELGGEIAKVLDFGVAKVMGASKKTRQGMVFGTPHYMSPEQGRGLPIDHRTDVYALGVILYECVTGQVPFVADTFMGVVTKHLFERPAPPPSSSPLAPLVLRCLEKEPAARYQSMGELCDELERVQQGVVAEPAPRPSLRLRGDEDSLAPGQLSLELVAPPRRSVWVAAGLLAAVCAGSAIWWASRSTESPPPAADPTVTSSTAASTATAGTVAATPTATAADPVAPDTAAPAPSEPRRPAAPPPRRPGPGHRPGGGEVVDPWGR
jgi:eukaryotic-like serine/threonine-protein kinase